MTLVTKQCTNESSGYHQIGENGLLACYVIAQFFFNFGPNSTTFIVPGECKLSTLPHTRTLLISTNNHTQASPLATVPPPTVSPPLPARSAPSSPRCSLVPCAHVEPPRRTSLHGSTTSCRSTLCSCSWAASPLFSFLRPNARLSSSLLARSLVLPSMILDSLAVCRFRETTRARRRRRLDTIACSSRRFRLVPVDFYFVCINAFF
jgi:hypothetical protein